ncbi:SlyX family protein [Hoeflea sp.]|uniref:SlyX family protein n=1 Tax=Hoeflea sp. TaxID=1940281 RepID=UPI003B528E26
MNPEEESRLVRLEELIAHQQATIDDLSRQLTEAWKEREKLRRDLSRLSDRFDELEDTAEAPPASQKPPHW